MFNPSNANSTWGLLVNDLASLAQMGLGMELMFGCLELVIDAEWWMCKRAGYWFGVDDWDWLTRAVLGTWTCMNQIGQRKNTVSKDTVRSESSMQSSGYHASSSSTDIEDVLMYWS
ncbi:Hypothetical protein MVR_LOCUS1 [uncultured virus]|nr:Hypothetical protein MVR_LOCUS1 [uncultured virus]